MPSGLSGMTKLCELKADICYYSESVMVTIKLPNVNAVKVPHSLYSAILLSLKHHLLRGLSSPDFLKSQFKISIHPPQNIFNLPSRATSLNMSQSIITVTQIGPTFPFPLN